MNTFQIWLETFLTEKGEDIDGVIEVETDNNWHIIPMQEIINFLASMVEYHAEIKKTFVMIDFKNGDHMHYFNHLAKGALVACGW